MADDLAPPGMVPLLCSCGRRVGWKSPDPDPPFVTFVCAACAAAA